MFSRLNSPFAWILTFFIFLFVYTKITGPVSFSVNSVNTTKVDTFAVSGEGKVSVKPDLATVSVGIVSSAQTVKLAQQQINSTINKISSVIKSLGIDQKDIQTRNYSIYPSYDYKEGNQKITGYNASTSLYIKVRDLDLLNQVIDSATLNGANTVSGASFDVEDKTSSENEARQLAVAEARKKAESAAKIAGFKLGKIINYSENFSPFFGALPYAGGSVSAITKETTPTQIEPGSSEISVNVTLSFEIL